MRPAAAVLPLACAVSAALGWAPATPPTGAPPAPAGPGAPVPPAPGAQPAGGGFSTISGRPPEPPLKRVQPRIWDARLEANLWVPVIRAGDVQTIQLSNIMVWMPMVMQSTYSQVDPQSIKTEIWTQGAKHADPASRTGYRQGLAQGMSAVGISVPDVKGQSLKWNVRWTEQCWSSQADEAACARVTWPTDWPAEVQESLQPQPGIEAGHEDFRKFVDKAVGGRLRSLTPWIAAKTIVRAVISSYNSVDGDGIRIENGFPRGIVFNGAHESMRNGVGSCHDVVAACVAALRTAGIPSRVVLGMADLPNSSNTATRARFISWAELYLPDAGWVPFSPNDLRGRIRGGLSPERPWPTFGTWDDLNRCLPVCYGWCAPVPGATCMPYPAGYAWTATGTIDLSQASDAVTLQILGRGRAKE